MDGVPSRMKVYRRTIKENIRVQKKLLLIYHQIQGTVSNVELLTKNENN